MPFLIPIDGYGIIIRTTERLKSQGLLHGNTARYVINDIDGYGIIYPVPNHTPLVRSLMII